VLRELASTRGQEDLADFLLNLLSGKASPALQSFARWEKAERKRYGVKKLKHVVPLAVLHCLAQISSNDPTQHKTLNKTLKTLSQEQLGAGLLNQLLNRVQGLPLTICEDQLDQSVPVPLPHALGGLMAMLAVQWLDWDTPRTWKKQFKDWCVDWQDAGYHGLAAECDAFLIHYGLRPEALSTLKNWHAERGLRPLVALHQKREEWEHTLEALKQLGAQAKKGDAVSTEPELRLAWLIDTDAESVHIEPREQRRSAGGQWSKGRAVALRRLSQAPGQFPYLSDKDRAVVTTAITRHVAPRDGYDWPPEEHWAIDAAKALPLLVDHPHLYRAAAPEVRFDLVAGSTNLHLDERDGHLSLSLEPKGDSSTGPLVIDETPTRIVVYPRSIEVQRVASIIGAGVSVPSRARAQLLEALSAVAPMLPVHSGIPELSVHMERIDGDSTIYAHLLPLAEGLRLQLLVRPKRDGTWLRPGQGTAHLIGEQNGQPVQIQRNLEDERTRLNTVLARCPALAKGDANGLEWHFENAQDALQILSELHAIEAQDVQCVWPEGEHMRIRAHPNMKSLSLAAKRQGDWFALQGEITLDDGRVLRLKQLLDLMQANANCRFVPLGAGDWIALSNDLRRRLSDVAHLSEKTDEAGAHLTALGAPLIEALSEEVGHFSADTSWQEHAQRLRSLRHFTPQVPRTLQAELRDYQNEGFIWLARLAEWGVGACLADDMGLGKTVQLLALLLHRASKGPQLVVAPTSVVGNWQSEALRFAPSLQVIDYRQTRSLENLRAGSVVLVSYGLLQNDQEQFAAQHWASVVLDEAQAVKNEQTKRSKSVMALQADFRAISSGTPLENHLGELWNLMRFLNPGLLGSRQRFTERFALPIEAGDTHARRALKQIIQPFLLRRLKSDVLDELPPRTEITHKVALSEEERYHYEALRQKAVDELAQSDLHGNDARFKALAQITRLRRFCCHPSLVLPGSALASSKLHALQRIVDELRDNRHRALVFSQFVDHLAIVRDWLDSAYIPYQYLDGASTPKARNVAIAAFQAGDGDLFLISLKAGGSGLNLTAADYVIHLDPWWNPAVEDQASDRAHRIGQQRPVTVYRLVAEHTIEEKIVALHAHKRDLADSLLEGGQASAHLDAEALLALIRQK